MNTMPWNTLDWVLAATIAFCVLRGIWKGAVSQVFGIVAVLCGFILAAHHFERVSVPFHETLPKFPQPHLAAFLLIFFLTWFCIGGIGYWISGVLRRNGLGFVDRLLGLGVGIIKAIIISAILISILTFFLSPKSEFLKDSHLTRYVQEGATFLIKATPKSVQEEFDKRATELRRSWSNRIEAGGERSKGLVRFPKW